MRRRETLAGVGTLFAGLAGCLSDGGAAGPETDEPGDDDPDGTDDGTDEPETTEPPSTGGAGSVGSVELDALLPGVVETTSPDSIGVNGGEDRQYLYLAVTPPTDGEAVASDEFTFAFGGTEFDRVTYDNEFRHWRTGDGSAYDAESGGWLLFEVPASAEDPGACALRWPGGEWTAGETLRERLAASPPPVDVSVEIPENVGADEQPTLAVTLENEGDLPAGVPLAVNRVGPRVAYAPLTAGRPTVEAGATATWEWTDEGVDLESGDGSATYHVHWHSGSTSGDVEATE